MKCFEETIIDFQDLPTSWKDETVLYELEEFLQKNWALRSMFFERGNNEGNQQFLTFLSHKAIRTNHYIGTIMFKGEELNIFPKMFREDKNDNQTTKLDTKSLMKNLIWWFEYYTRRFHPFVNVMSNLEDTDSFKDLFISLFVGFVKVVIGRGAHFQYIDETDDLVFLKGKFNASDYFKNKIPSGRADKFRCTYSRFDSDHKINQIIKYTCRIIYPISSKNNQRSINYILTKLNEVSEEKCTPEDCEKIRLSNIYDREKFDSYRIIIDMCKIILLNQSVGLDSGHNNSFCFLFPTDKLFEEFVAGFIEEVVSEYNGNTHIQRSDKQLIDYFVFDGTTYDEKAFILKPDILVEVQGKSYILDTKYKAISRFQKYYSEIKELIKNDVDQGDLYQICEYARKHSISDVFLLYPMYRNEEYDSKGVVGISNGSSGKIRIHFIRLPFIIEEYDKTKQMLKKTIEDMLELS